MENSGPQRRPGLARPAVVSFEQAPPISVPMRFFLAAPLFGVAAALVVLFEGTGIWISRWSAGTLALTHLMTLGFLAMVMVGSLMQILPVVAGAPIRHVLIVSGTVHALLGLGTLALVDGFLFRHVRMLRLALMLLAAAFIVFVGAAADSLVRARNATITVRGMRYSIAALTVTVCLGLLLGGARAWQLRLAVPRITALHLVWGLMGWVGLLVVSVGFQVVPMFQTTPPYPRNLAAWLPGLTFATLSLWSLARWIGTGSVPARDVLAALASLLGLGFALFAVTTLALQRRRRREMPDVTVRFWRIGMASLLGSVLIGWTALWNPGAVPPPVELSWGILVIFGFGASVISGMLYKIVPFLVWLHLQASAGGRGKLPNMKEIIPDRRAGIQLDLHVAALLLLTGAPWLPGLLTYPGAAALGLSNLLLWANLFSAYRLYGKNLAGRCG
ncbi:MAG: hypothetical protein M0Z84_06430 [Gammaproteobacteria bacterium]|nr:hypothetical protein [Gammaproteobacteria bacterium]